MHWGLSSEGDVMMSEEELREQGLLGVEKAEMTVFRHWEGFKEARAVLLGAQWYDKRQRYQASTRQILLRYQQNEREEPVGFI